jgi:hypothetical protein
MPYANFESKGFGLACVVGPYLTGLWRGFSSTSENAEAMAHIKHF